MGDVRCGLRAQPPACDGLHFFFPFCPACHSFLHLLGACEGVRVRVTLLFCATLAYRASQSDCKLIALSLWAADFLVRPAITGGCLAPSGVSTLSPAVVGSSKHMNWHTRDSNARVNTLTVLDTVASRQPAGASAELLTGYTSLACRPGKEGARQKVTVVFQAHYVCQLNRSRFSRLKHSERSTLMPEAWIAMNLSSPGQRERLGCLSL